MAASYLQPKKPGKLQSASFYVWRWCESGRCVVVIMGGHGRVPKSCCELPWRPGSYRTESAQMSQWSESLCILNISLHALWYPRCEKWRRDVVVGASNSTATARIARSPQRVAQFNTMATSLGRCEVSAARGYYFGSLCLPFVRRNPGTRRHNTRYGIKRWTHTTPGIDICVRYASVCSKKHGVVASSSHPFPMPAAQNSLSRFSASSASPLSTVKLLRKAYLFTYHHLIHGDLFQPSQRRYPAPSQCFSPSPVALPPHQLSSSILKLPHKHDHHRHFKTSSPFLAHPSIVFSCPCQARSLLYDFRPPPSDRPSQRRFLSTHSRSGSTPIHAYSAVDFPSIPTFHLRLGASSAELTKILQRKRVRHRLQRRATTIRILHTVLFPRFETSHAVVDNLAAESALAASAPPRDKGKAVPEGCPGTFSLTPDS
ncbi:uncharacterized protein BDZ99DRAFT_470882 [Mytilinidion resinicola]|uniref:Uncharacterized protein n=1 Tax=Mytilinidion resinicola TaxID=574789 RepID=A0A6A6ZB78_9PEZI|nr:uncharacterized protein BDZ99DRAFT_470882 [Mytilinidion resinicola]KAF2817949.1 hypothetical protein BDZ99DRAFT_470882 [Mytilinidion resinicola]